MTQHANDDVNEGRLSAAGHKVGDVASMARDKAADAASAVRDQAGSAIESARGTATHTIETAPFAVLAGGIALGAALGALLPRSNREAELLGPVAAKATDAARNAYAAAKSAGQEKLDELGVNKQAARAKVDELVKSASEAATSAGTAAKDAVRKGSDA